MALTKVQQVREVVDGMGLGLIALGADRVSSSKLDLEFAFSHAWRWSRANDYPSIGRAHKPDNEFWIGVGKSERRLACDVTWIQVGAEYELVNIGDRPLEQWVALATPFLEHLNETKARRHNPT
jgi:hypothetical protein